MIKQYINYDNKPYVYGFLEIFYDDNYALYVYFFILPSILIFTFVIPIVIFIFLKK